MVGLNNLIELIYGLEHMNKHHKEELSKLLKSMRGDYSYRDFQQKIGINYASLRSWEKQESFPNLESLEVIAGARGWTVIRLLQYLGFEISSSQIKEFILVNFDRDERIKLARELLDFE